MDLKYRPKIIFLSFCLLLIIPIIIPKAKSKIIPNSNDETLRLIYRYCTNSTAFAPNSSYNSTVNTLFNRLIANSSDNPTGFYSTSVIYNNTLNGYFLCRGDLNTRACNDCVYSAVMGIKDYCPAWSTSKEGILFWNKCMIRYAYNETLHGVLALEPELSEQNVGYIPENKDDLRRLIYNTFRILATEAANDKTAGRKYARTAVNFTALTRVYAMAQCTPDLSVGDCQSCLTYAIGKFQVRAGENSLTPSCSVRYELYPFFEGADTLPSGRANTSGISCRRNSGPIANSGGTSKWKAIIAALVILGTVALVIFLYFLYGRYDKSAWKTATNLEAKDKIKDLPLFKLKDLVIATDNFSESNMLGRGGFGAVYKGKFENGEEIAVKRLSKTSVQGLQEFMNEVVVISKLQHTNLVRLLGCCVHGEEKLLAYEYMPYKSLDAFLFDPSNQVHLDWKKRFNIVKGISRGLLYLHRDSRLRIIHRDLKASNILLDGNLNPKISDFGMAKIFEGSQAHGETKRIVGTYGYMSPEYVMEGRFSEKSDVFSLGVLLLEIVSGRRNNKFKDENSLSLLGHAWKLWKEEKILSLVDPNISESTSYVEILKCIQLGLLCVQEFPEARPSSSMVVSMIEGEDTDLPLPSQPGFTLRGNCCHNVAHQNGHEYCSVDGASITCLNGR